MSRQMYPRLALIHDVAFVLFRQDVRFQIPVESCQSNVPCPTTHSLEACEAPVEDVRILSTWVSLSKFVRIFLRDGNKVQEEVDKGNREFLHSHWDG